MTSAVEVEPAASRPALWSAVSSRDAAAVATRWQPRRRVPFGIVVEREGAAQDREAIRFKIAEEEGCYRGIRAWNSAQSFLAGLRLYLRHYPGALRGPNKGDSISLEAFMAVMTATATQAHPATGRGCRAHKKWVAAQAGCSEDHVKRAWRFAERRLDVLREVRRARPLRWYGERAELLGEGLGGKRCALARRMPDMSQCRQRGVTPLRAFHLPAWLAPWVALATQRLQASTAASGAHESPSSVDHAPLPVRSSPESPPHLEDMETCAHGTVSLRSTRGTRSARHSDQPRGRRSRRTIRGERLAQAIAQMLGWATNRHQSGPAFSPRRTAPALADFEDAGWSPQQWLATARAVAESIEYPWPTSSQQIASPGGWVAWLTRYMVPDEPPAETDGAPAAPPWLQPCGRPDCDGHGWLRVDPDPVSGQVTAQKCPHCPARIREATPEQIERRDLAFDSLRTCVACGSTDSSVTVRDDLPLASAVCERCWTLAGE